MGTGVDVAATQLALVRSGYAVLPGAVPPARISEALAFVNANLGAVFNGRPLTGADADEKKKVP